MNDYSFFIIGGALILIALVITFYLGMNRGYRLGKEDAQEVASRRWIKQSDLNGESTTFWSRS